MDTIAIKATGDKLLCFSACYAHYFVSCRWRPISNGINFFNPENRCCRTDSSVVQARIACRCMGCSMRFVTTESSNERKMPAAPDVAKTGKVRQVPVAHKPVTLFFNINQCYSIPELTSRFRTEIRRLPKQNQGNMVDSSNELSSSSELEEIANDSNNHR